ncbi:unnamed protein product [Phytomonas sp. EM1]|nr:unnamed protein product [Phytomonas sp. EM1]|eukprot:CCW65378.1 unnamed protein product [Phytomonas sp. isolate EM1]
MNRKGLKTYFEFLSEREGGFSQPLFIVSIEAVFGINSYDA